MKINITKQQYQDLINMIGIANGVYGILGDVISDDMKKISTRMHDLEDYFLKYAKQYDCEDFIEYYEDKIIISDSKDDELREISDLYDDYIFWDELNLRLGKRDFFNTITKQEEKEIDENNGWLPERIHELYEKYEKEFDKFGIDRLVIDEKQKKVKMFIKHNDSQPLLS